MLLHPTLSARSCEDCKQFHYDDSPKGMGKLAMRGGKPVRRLPTHETPCRWCPKIPEGAAPVPSSAVEISEKNVAAFCHYRECEAVGEFPDDPIVRRNAAIISQIVKEAEKTNALNDQLFAMSSSIWGKKK